MINIDWNILWQSGIIPLFYGFSGWYSNAKSETSDLGVMISKFEWQQFGTTFAKLFIPSIILAFGASQLDDSIISSIALGAGLMVGWIWDKMSKIKTTKAAINIKIKKK
jgi:hypothetical protein